ncbi:FHA domain-containing protein [Gleimia sp. 6138-11-ORH1]|uniref:FHA domain-containing protein n=1 Tax=Gleimia sp. 6138-11-ORH1 TaxID=2973937 RepID=UPI00216867C2|nr:FHA domain-containing protein [Gleimia sp. 6138-11-ORH1]MCS4484346.1 FHA domain-containing protein [Gleimia sp. 6138-11-ORH1]
MSETNLPDPSETSIFGALGTGIEADDTFVTPALSAHDRAAVEALPAGSALLIVQRGPNSGARFLLDEDQIVAGRSPQADIFLDDVTVSRKHCEFKVHENGFLVRDLGSLNGTYVNRERSEVTVLQAGDEVQIGKYRLTYHPSPAQ